ncbi:MAG: hydantoinase/oxoprolinase family protein [Desulfobacula sp.]|nr:hydantoinase/oxoprolinase family protein [Desulfobacula sp.]
MGYTIDIDTGGTFTDGFFVVKDRVETIKVPTTPHDLTICFLECIKAGAKRFNVMVEDLLYETDIIRFSNTIGTNTIIQRDGSRVGLIVTQGYEDSAPTHSQDDKSSLIMSEMVVALDEQVSQAGEIIKTPDEKTIMAAAQDLIDKGARCLVVAFANSEYNSQNERFVRKTIKNEYPRDFLGSVPVFLSSDISHRSGNTERINAAVLNAYIHNKLAGLLYKASENLRQKSYNNNLFIVHNNGAVARVAKTRAINTYNSGPVAGLSGARLIGQLYGSKNLISADMGGTSCDIGFVNNGQESYTLMPDVESFSINVPMMVINAIGAGGGSIASVTDGKLQVGPQSAGALPGPVCFDLGGFEPTVTDADLVLGVLDPHYFLGGTMALNYEKAKDSIEQKIAIPLGISVEEAAHKIKSSVDQAMGVEVGNLKDSLKEDDNPMLVVYGGAGAAHCCNIAKIAGLKKIVITPFSAVFSAFSSSNMDVGHFYSSRTDILFKEDADFSKIKDSVLAMEKEAGRDMRGEGFSLEELWFELELFAKVEGQDHEVKFMVEYDFYKTSEQVQNAVETARKLLNISNSEDSKSMVLTMVSLLVKAKVPHYEIKEVEIASHNVSVAKKGHRNVFLQTGRAALEIPVFDRSLLTNGHRITGPGLVESEQTSLLIPLEWELNVDKYNNMILEEVS